MHQLSRAGGKAESARIIFLLGAVPFEDERLSYEEFQSRKGNDLQSIANHVSAAGKFKAGQVPVLEVDGEQIAQSYAIAKYAAKLSGTSHAHFEH